MNSSWRILFLPDFVFGHKKQRVDSSQWNQDATEILCLFCCWIMHEHCCKKPRYQSFYIKCFLNRTSVHYFILFLCRRAFWPLTCRLSKRRQTTRVSRFSPSTCVVPQTTCWSWANTTANNPTRKGTKSIWENDNFSTSTRNDCLTRKNRREASSRRICRICKLQGNTIHQLAA